MCNHVFVGHINGVQCKFCGALYWKVVEDRPDMLPGVVEEQLAKVEARLAELAPHEDDTL